ncbi:LicD family protein [Eubacterium xylanophilum]|uniref:LicD family protein n=1 Tax=Eubacterium xylanophilum TaxID=39497 RepID=UPI00047EC091|nr:LicD family protein [Eubacterium xylanophilum]
MRHRLEYLKDEVRCGFYIPTAIKQAWANYLDVLDVIDRICTKHGIVYFAEWGSLLGAVRHGGVIPWDDDVDICMKREDYIKFRQVADEELPEGFTIHDYNSLDDHWMFLSRVVNSERVNFDEDYLAEHYNFPWLVGIDIFLKDYLYKDRAEERARCKEVLRLIAMADTIREKKGTRELIDRLIRDIEEKYSVKLAEKSPLQISREVYGLAERQMARVKREDSDLMEQMFPWVLKDVVPGYPKEYFDHIVRLPFEDTTMPMPAYYTKTMRYGDYLAIHKKWDGHDYPFFETSKRIMEENAGEKLGGFSFDEALMERKRPEQENSLKVICEECLGEIAKMSEELGDAEKLAAMQQMAIDLGTLIEQVLGEKSDRAKACVAVLQELCEKIFGIYTAITEGVGGDIQQVGELESVIRALEKTIEENILRRRTVVFLANGPTEWDGLRNIYLREKGRPDTDVFVVPMPVFAKDAYGQVVASDEEIAKNAHIEEYPEELECRDWREFELGLVFADVIYSQCSWDYNNPYLTWPPGFYTGNLQRFSPEIVYCPLAGIGDFGPEDELDWYVMNHYITMPGAIAADKIYARSECLRQRFVEKLTDFSGEEFREEWERRVVVEPGLVRATAESEETGGPKKMLVCIGINEMFEHEKVFLESVRNRFDILGENRENIQPSIFLYPPDRSEWERANPEMAGKLWDLIEERDYWGEPLEFDPRFCTFSSWIERAVGEFDAYYGSSTPVMTAFRQEKKPVMLGDFGMKME